MNKHLLRSIVFLSICQLISFSVNGQDHSVKTSYSILFAPPDFYQGFEAVSDPNITARYANGIISNVVEQYRFEPIQAVTIGYEYIIHNQRKPKASFSIESAIGFSWTSFSITPAINTRLENYGAAIRVGSHVVHTFNFNYIPINIGVNKIHHFKSKGGDLKYGLHLRNLILIESRSQMMDYFLDQIYNGDNIRLLGRQSYLLLALFNMAYSKQIGKNLHIEFNMNAGISPTNLLRYEEYIESKFNSDYIVQGTSAFEPTQKINLLYGFGICLAYEI